MRSARAEKEKAGTRQAPASPIQPFHVLLKVIAGITNLWDAFENRRLTRGDGNLTVRRVYLDASAPEVCATAISAGTGALFTLRILLHRRQRWFGVLCHRWHTYRKNETKKH
jgi:hypothetical protein